MILDPGEQKKEKGDRSSHCPRSIEEENSFYEKLMGRSVLFIFTWLKNHMLPIIHIYVHIVLKFFFTT